MTCQPVSFCQGHFSQLPLADPSEGSSPLDIDILIGSDQYIGSWLWERPFVETLGQ